MSCQKFQRELTNNFSVQPQITDSSFPEIYQYRIVDHLDAINYHNNCKRRCCIKERPERLVEIKIGGLKFSITPLTFFVFISLILMIVIIILVTR